MNPFSYASNSPVNYVDAEGLRYFLYGDRTAVSNFEYLIEEE